MIKFIIDVVRKIISNETNEVKFHKVTVFKHPTIEELPRESIWYQSSDYDLFNDDVDLMVEYIIYHKNKIPRVRPSNTRYTPSSIDRKDDNYDDDDDHSVCTRGVENQLKHSETKRQHNRRELWKAVLDEQFRQWRNGIEDPTTIAEACLNAPKEFSKDGSDEDIARQKGMRDADVAKRIHENTPLEFVITGSNMRRVGRRPKVILQSNKKTCIKKSYSFTRKARRVEAVTKEKN